MDDDIEIEAPSLNVLAKPAALVRFGHRSSEAFGRPEVLAANIDVGFVAPNRVSGDDHAFEQRVRIALEDVSILEGSRFSLVGIDDEIPGLQAGFRDEGPFSAGWKPRAAQTAEVGPRDLVDDLRGRHRRERFPGGDITAVCDVGVPPRAARVPETRRDDGPVGGDEGVRLIDPGRTRVGRDRVAFDGVNGRSVQRADELLVELPCRRDLAGTEALDFGQRQFAVRGRLAWTNVQALLDLRQHIACAPQHARQAGANAQLVPARFTRPKHRVERHHFPDMRERDAQQPSDPAFGLRWDVTNVGLNQPQQRQHGRPRLVVTFDNFQSLWLERCEVHRSSSPPIMLIDPNVGVRSAIMSPMMSFGRADMMAKHGGRTRTR